MNEDKTTDAQGANPYQAQPAPKSSRGCCLWGCLIMFLLVVLVFVGGGLGTYFWVKGQVNRYTADAPANLPVVTLPEEQLVEIQGRIDNFKKTIEAGGTPDDLVLTAEELNALMTKDENMRGKIFVTIEDGEVAGEVSLPADAFPGGKGRFFNASASFNVSLENGVLIVTLQDAEVKGEKLPQQFIDAISKENLAKDAYKDPKVAETLRRIESISIEHDKVVLKPRVAASEGAGNDAAAGEDQPATEGSPAPEVPSEAPESNEPAGAEASTPAEPTTTTEAE